MEPSDRQPKEIFVGALDIAAGPGRSAYVERECLGDASLRDRVEALLEAHENAGRFLDTGAPGDESPRPETTAPELTEPSGSRPARISLGHVGPYKLLEQIGGGGMGTVYMAEQERPVRRRVALKIIKPGMDSHQVVARFEAERQALALMDHPNIARVLDAGQTDSGQPYFVMELVNGSPITRYCDDARLLLKERLELFAAVCDAVQHAHQKGIIHRDIKPSNVLVTLIDGRPSPKVIDFGVAKAIDQRLTERTMFTQFGAIVGTLEYMSPEQATLSGLDVDTRSDIYALGVLLYELLTGTTPLEGASLRQAGYDEILRRIKEEEPPKPSTRLSSSGEKLASIAATRGVEPFRLTRAVRGDLDWIVMKALEKDRTRRFATANGFARDIRRYLDGDPVEACPPSAAYLLKKLVSKHRGPLVVGAICGVAIALGILGLIVGYLEAHQAATVARAEAARALEAEAETALQRDAESVARRRAETAEATARTEADKAEAINDFLTQDLLVQAEPANNQVGNRVTLQEVLDRAADRVEDRFRDRPEIESSLRWTIGQTYHGLGAYAKAEQHLRAAAEIARRHRAEDDPVTLRAERELAHMEMHLRRHSEALDRLDRVLRSQTRLLGPDHHETLATVNLLARVYRETGDYAKAEPLFAKCLEGRRRVLGDDDPETLATMNYLGMLYRDSGHHEQAERLLVQCLEKRRRVLGPENPYTLQSMNVLGVLYLKSGLHDRAEALFVPCLAARLRVLGAVEPNTLISVRNLAWLCSARGPNAKSMTPLVRFLEAEQRGPEHELDETLQAVESMADLYRSWMQPLRPSFYSGQSWASGAAYSATVARGRQHPDQPGTCAARHGEPRRGGGALA
jgi:serine/threonine protein kinase